MPSEPVGISRWAAFSPWVAFAQAIPLSAVSVAGIVGFGCLRFAYGLFYGAFGVTPEEVGLGYGQVLAQAILIALVMIAFLAIWLRYAAEGVKDVLLDIGGFPRRFRGRFIRARREGWPILVLYLTYWPALIAGVMAPGKENPWVARLCAALLVYSVYAWFKVHESIPHEPISKRVPKWLLILSPSGRTVRTAQRLAIPFVLIVVLPFWAVQDTHHVKNGRPAVSGWMFGLVMWDGRPALVQWLGDTLSAPKAVLRGHRLMYLGGADGIAVFYDATDSLTVRLPAGAVSITTPATRDTFRTRG